MAHVGVKRFGARDSEEDAAHHHETDDAVAEQERQSVEWIEGIEDARRIADMHHAERGDDDEPHRHDRAEPARDAGGTFALHEEQRDQNDERDQRHVMIEMRRHQFETFDRRKHGDRWSDDGVAGEKRGADNAEEENGAGTAADGLLR